VSVYFLIAKQGYAARKNGKGVNGYGICQYEIQEQKRSSGMVYRHIPAHFDYRLFMTVGMFPL
jgi:hypothetical protein